MAMFRRLPWLRWKLKVNQEIVPQDVQGEYPAFSQDFGFLEGELLPSFRGLDNEALRAQNQFRLEQLLLILGGALSTILGAVQATLANTVWPGIVLFVLAAALGVVAARVRQLKAQDLYFTSRLKAEMLRGEYFLYVGRIGIYSSELDRKKRLAERVAFLVAGEAEADV
jgi:hypothetical protein